MAKLNKTDEKIVAALRAEGKELSLQELSDKTGETSKKTFRSCVNYLKTKLSPHRHVNIN